MKSSYTIIFWISASVTVIKVCNDMFRFLIENALLWSNSNGMIKGNNGHGMWNLVLE